MIQVGDHFYWFGEWRQPNGTIDGVSVYRSPNLRDWEYRGAALSRSAVPGSLNLPNIERPKVIYNAEHDHYVMWMHVPIVGACELHARLMPAIRRVGAKRRKAAFRLRVTNAGDGPAGSIRICAQAPRKWFRIQGPACRAYPTLAAGGSVQRLVRGRIMRRARGRTTRVRFVVNGPSVSRVDAVARLVVRR